MARGFLRVFICNGSNLSNPEKEGKICVLAYYKDQHHRTQAVYCDGPDPEWDERLETIWIEDDIEDLKLRIHDGDHVTEEEIGYCEISLESLLETGDAAEIEPIAYDCYRNHEEEPYGHIVLGLSFEPLEEEGEEDENEECEEDENEEQEEDEDE